jgi:sugar O-acyltransferase (sialic acid O-acetyltransferase NeuD family)
MLILNVNKMKDLIILGAGGEALEIVQVTKLLNKINQEWNIIGFLDDNMNLIGKEISGIKVIGSIKDSKNYPNSYFISSIGHPDRPMLRKEVRDKVPFNDNRFATIIHPSAVICDTANLGYGCFIQANCVISTNTLIGNNVLIAYGSIIGHESEIGQDSVIGVGVLITSDVITGKSIYVGPGATFTNNINIGNNVLIGIGSVVTESVPENTKYLNHIRLFKLPLETKNPYNYE